MGVKGIYSLITTSSAIPQHDLMQKDLDIIVDGLTMWNHLKQNSIFFEKNFCADTMYTCIENMFKWFDYLHFHIKFFIFDGLYLFKKTKTMCSRSQTNFNINVKNTFEDFKIRNFKNLNGSNLFINTLLKFKKENIKYDYSLIRAFHDADLEIVQYANKYKCVVLHRDSDIFIQNIPGSINIDDIPCYFSFEERWYDQFHFHVYTTEDVCTVLGISKEHLFILPAFLDNDFTEHDNDESQIFHIDLINCDDRIKAAHENMKQHKSTVKKEFQYFPGKSTLQYTFTILEKIHEYEFIEKTESIIHIPEIYSNKSKEWKEGFCIIRYVYSISDENENQIESILDEIFTEENVFSIDDDNLIRDLQTNFDIGYVNTVILNSTVYIQSLLEDLTEKKETDQIIQSNSSSEQINESSIEDELCLKDEYLTIIQILFEELEFANNIHLSTDEYKQQIMSIVESEDPLVCQFKQMVISSRYYKCVSCIGFVLRGLVDISGIMGYTSKSCLERIFKREITLDEYERYLDKNYYKHLISRYRSLKYLLQKYYNHSYPYYVTTPDQDELFIHTDSKELNLIDCVTEYMTHYNSTPTTQLHVFCDILDHSYDLDPEYEGLFTTFLNTVSSCPYSNDNDFIYKSLLIIYYTHFERIQYKWFTLCLFIFFFSEHKHNKPFFIMPNNIRRNKDHYYLYDRPFYMLWFMPYYENLVHLIDSFITYGHCLGNHQKFNFSLCYDFLMQVYGLNTGGVDINIDTKKCHNYFKIIQPFLYNIPIIQSKYNLECLISETWSNVKGSNSACKINYNMQWILSIFVDTNSLS